MDLEAYRKAEGLTYDQLAKLMGVHSVSQMRRLALGEELLKDMRLEKAIEISGGMVTAFAVHQRRIGFLRSRPGGIGPQFDGGDDPENGGPADSSEPECKAARL